MMNEEMASKEASSAGMQNQVVATAVQQRPPRVEVQSFAVRLPDNIMQDWDEPEPKSNTSLMMMGNTGIVGTVTLLENAVIIWFGWGSIANSGSNPSSIGGDANRFNSITQVVGSGSNQSMGEFIVAMPRSKYSGAFSENESPTSKLIGGEGDEMIGRQMASRLSQRFGIPIFVSCSLTGTATIEVMQSKGMDHENVNQRAAVLAELEIRKLLEGRKEENRN